METGRKKKLCGKNCCCSFVSCCAAWSTMHLLIDLSLPLSVKCFHCLVVTYSSCHYSPVSHISHLLFPDFKFQMQFSLSQWSVSRDKSRAAAICKRLRWDKYRSVQPIIHVSHLVVNTADRADRGGKKSRAPPRSGKTPLCWVYTLELAISVPRNCHSSNFPEL